MKIIFMHIRTCIHTYARVSVGMHVPTVHTYVYYLKSTFGVNVIVVPYVSLHTYIRMFIQ